MQSLVLLSGGLDSLACLAHSLTSGVRTSALFVDYGQAAAEQERAGVAEISRAMRVEVSVVTVRGLTISNGCIRGRNALLLQIGLMHFPSNNGTVVLGIHAGARYADCSPVFVREAQRLYDLYSDGAIRVSAPFKGWSKSEIWEYLQTIDAPIELTYSCERGGEKPCNECLSCQEINVLRSR